MAGDPVGFELIPITPSPDKYTCYIQNYVGKNLASFGYTSMGGDRRDKYGQSSIKLNLVTDDGTYPPVLVLYYLHILPVYPTVCL